MSRNLGDFIPPQAYAQQAGRASGGAPPVSGMAPYPLYGLPTMGDAAADTVPVYRRPLVCFAAGAATVGLAWAYFGWWRPRSKRVKSNGMMSVSVKGSGRDE